MTETKQLDANPIRTVAEPVEQPAGVVVSREWLESLRNDWYEADSKRMEEMRQRENEADKWKKEGDMYGWNFHQGAASGLCFSSVYYPMLRKIENALAADARRKANHD